MFLNTDTRSENSSEEDLQAPSLAFRWSPRPRTCRAQVSRTAPPLAGAAPATTHTPGVPAARRWTGSPISSPGLPRPASGPGVSRLGRRWPQLCVHGSDPGPGVQVSEPLRFLASHRCPRWYREFDPPCRLGCGFAGGQE